MKVCKTQAKVLNPSMTELFKSVKVTGTPLNLMLLQKFYKFVCVLDVIPEAEYKKLVTTRY